MFLSAWKQDGFELIWSRNSYSFLMPGLLLTSWFIFICLLDFFVYEMLDYITATFSFFFKAYEVWLLSTTKMKTEWGEKLQTCRICRLFLLRVIIFLSGDPKLQIRIYYSECVFKVSEVTFPWQNKSCKSVLELHWYCFAQGLYNSKPT